MCYGEILSASIVRARKPHGCSDCGRKIAAGKQYYRSAAADHGEITTTKMCRTCYCAAIEASGSESCWYTSSGEARSELRLRPWRAVLSALRGVWSNEVERSQRDRDRWRAYRAAKRKGAPDA